jgi:hypothetical protein
MRRTGVIGIFRKSPKRRNVNIIAAALSGAAGNVRGCGDIQPCPCRKFPSLWWEPPRGCAEGQGASFAARTALPQAPTSHPTRPSRSSYSSSTIHGRFPTPRERRNRPTGHTPDQQTSIVLVGQDCLTTRPRCRHRHYRPILGRVRTLAAHRDSPRADRGATRCVTRLAYGKPPAGNRSEATMISLGLGIGPGNNR